MALTIKTRRIAKIIPEMMVPVIESSGFIVFPRNDFIASLIVLDSGVLAALKAPIVNKFTRLMQAVSPASHGRLVRTPHCALLGNLWTPSPWTR